MEGIRVTDSEAKNAARVLLDATPSSDSLSKHVPFPPRSPPLLKLGGVSKVDKTSLDTWKSLWNQWN
jgi:hypothetical protein